MLVEMGAPYSSIVLQRLNPHLQAAKKRALPQWERPVLCALQFRDKFSERT
jgi:hypothetical protein